MNFQKKTINTDIKVNSCEINLNYCRKKLKLKTKVKVTRKIVIDLVIYVFFRD